ncbi:outer membrane beta-barrel protein [Psychroserpens sp. BH13MA-6]
MKWTKILVTSCCFFSMLTALSQSPVNFGVKGGLNLTFFKVTEAQFGNNIETEVGYYGGVFADFEVDEFVSIQPEVLYISLTDFQFINAPIYAKFRLSDRLDFLAGPSLNYFFDFFNNKLKVRGDIATAYNLSNHLDLHMKFVLGFNEVAPNGLFLGAGYKF